MIRRHARLLVVLAPVLLGLLARLAEFGAANSALTATPGRVAPQEIASTIAAGDLLLFLGCSVSLALALVWLGAAASRGARGMAPRAILSLGLLLAAVGSLKLQALNEALVEDYRGAVAAAWSQPEEEAVGQAEAFYEATYSLERPVHASTQLAGLVAGGEGAFDRASRTRGLGLVAMVVAGILGLAGSRRRERAEPAAA